MENPKKNKKRPRAATVDRIVPVISASVRVYRSVLGAFSRARLAGSTIVKKPGIVRKRELSESRKYLNRENIIIIIHTATGARIGISRARPAARFFFLAYQDSTPYTTPMIIISSFNI